jgi:hypothetical protein
MKKLNEQVLYFHDYMTDEDEVQREIRQFQRQFANNDILVEVIEETEDMPLFGKRNYDILLFDWGGASIGNSMLRHFCEYILKEAIENPSKVFIMVSSFTSDAMEEAENDFKSANGEVPTNVFLNINDACRFL